MAILSTINQYALIGAFALGALVAIIVAIVCAVNGKKESQAELDGNTALSEYDGIDGFVSAKKESAVEEESVDDNSEQIEELPEIEEVAEPVLEIVEEAATEQPVAPVPTTAPAEEAPVEKAPELTQENPISSESVPLDQRQGDWSNYDGEYDGYYYDPIDVCYYEGNPPVYVQKMYLPPVERVVRKIKSPAAPLMDKPLAKRGEIKPVKGFDVAVIYGQYIIEHEEDEYFFTLYSNKGELLYESFNYSTNQYCHDAVKRFKKHVLAGAFSVEEHEGKFRFILIRKLNTYYGPEKQTRVEAEQSIETLKYYAQSDVVREQ